MTIGKEDRARFDELLDQVLAELPPQLTKLFDEIPLVAEDEPSGKMLGELGLRSGRHLQGVHSGVPLTRRSVQHSGVLPTVITIYRRGILNASRDEAGRLSDETLRREIRVTILHELGHHFGMDEDDLRRHGYD